VDQGGDPPGKLKKDQDSDAPHETKKWSS